MSIFLLDALVSVLSSLRFAGQGTEEVEEAAYRSLKHMQRILVHHRSLFLVEAKDRRKPLELEGGSLKHLQLYLLSLSTVPYTCLRHKAMELLFVLHRHSPLDWKTELDGQHGGGESFLRKLVENQPGLQQAELSSLTALEAVAWLEGLQAVLECVGMVVSENLIPICAVSSIGNKLSFLCKALIDKAVVKDEDVLPKDLEKLRNAKCTALIRLFALLTAFLHSGDVVLQEVVQNLDRSLIKVLLMSVLEPSQVGFKLKTKEARRDFQGCCNSLLQAIANNLPHLKEKLMDSLSQDYTQSDFFSPEAIVKADRLGHIEEEAILGYLQIQQQGLLTISWSAIRIWEAIKARVVVKKESKAQSKCLPLLVELVVTCCFQEKENQTLEEFRKLALDEDSQSKRLLQLFRRPLAPLFLPRARPLLSECLTRPQKHHFLNLSKLLLKMGEAEGSAGEVKVREIVREVTLMHWLDLVECGGETWLHQLIRHLTVISDLGNNWEKGEEVVRWWCDSLSSPSLGLKVKFRLLALLQGISKLAGLTGEALVRAALLRLSSLHFPVVSGELKEGSPELAEYTSIWRLLLSSLEATAYPPIFYLLLSVACREEEHCLEEEFQAISFAFIFCSLYPCYCRLPCSIQFQWPAQLTSIVFLTLLGESWLITLEILLLGSSWPQPPGLYFLLFWQQLCLLSSPSTRVSLTSF